VARPQGRPLISAFEHFAAGVVFSAVAIDLVLRLREIDRPVPMVAGFIAGAGAMMASRRWFEAAGALVPTAVDLFIDGLLIATCCWRRTPPAIRRRSPRPFFSAS
jgi:zinc transporter, ZIP family